MTHNIFEKFPYLNEMRWYVLWCPLGIKNFDAIIRIIKREDAANECYVPMTTRIRNENEEVVPVFSSYMFVRCKWHPRLEEIICENSTNTVLFLKSIDEIPKFLS